MWNASTPLIDLQSPLIRLESRRTLTVQTLGMMRWNVDRLTFFSGHLEMISRKSGSLISFSSLGDLWTQSNQIQLVALSGHVLLKAVNSYLSSRPLSISSSNLLEISSQHSQTWNSDVLSISSRIGMLFFFTLFYYFLKF